MASTPTGLRPLTDASGSPLPPQYVMVAPAAVAPRSRGILSKFFGGLMLSLLVMSIIANVYLAGIIAMLTGGPHEVTYRHAETKDRIVILPVEGMITAGTQDFIEQSLQTIAAAPNDMPRAIILRVDSPGGYVGPSDRILNMIERFQKKHPSIPIVASYGSVAASGGYYVSASCDKIFAEPTCTTGSIGVIIAAFTYGDLMKKIGVEPRVFIADGSPKKDVANNPFRPMEERDEEKIKDLLNNAHEQFVAVVTRGRAGVLSPDEVKALANGDTYNTKEAVANKLIDGAGYLDDVIEETKKIAKITGDVRVTWMHMPRGFNPLGSILGQGRSAAPGLPTSGEEVRDWLRDASHPRLEYLWSPGM